MEASRYPTIDSIATALGPEAVVRPVPVPFDCVDGFTEAFYGRPEAFLDPEVRRSQSAWTFVEPEVTAGCVRRWPPNSTRDDGTGGSAACVATLVPRCGPTGGRRPLMEPDRGPLPADYAG